MDLDIERTALEVISCIRPLVIAIERFDKDLGKQIRRSSSSVPLNISEGALSQGKNRNARFYNAIGSARETRTALEVAQAWGYLETNQLKAPLDAYDKIIATLYRLINSPKR